MSNNLSIELIYILNKDCLLVVIVILGNIHIFRCKYFEYMFKSVRRKKIQHFKQIMAWSVYSFEGEVSEYSTDARKMYMYCEEKGFLNKLQFRECLFFKNQLKMHFLVKHTTFFVKIFDHEAKSPTCINECFSFLRRTFSYCNIDSIRCIER